MVENGKPQGLPLVSCLCVTKCKVPQLRRAINCFNEQTYSNKELVVIYERSDGETKEFAEKSHSRDIRFVEIPPTSAMTLGALRNISIAQSKGEYFCQWDDDDWYHRDRVDIQMKAALLNMHPASTLTNWLLFDELTGQAYFSHVRLWEGSILCKRDIYTQGLRYPSMPRGEDMVFIRSLLRKFKIFPVVAPNLYIYVIHGKNTWSYDHFERLFKTAQKLPDFVSEMIRDILTGKISPADGSEMLNSEKFLEQIDYFHYIKFAAEDEDLF